METAKDRLEERETELDNLISDLESESVIEDESDVQTRAEEELERDDTSGSEEEEDEEEGADFTVGGVYFAKNKTTYIITHDKEDAEGNLILVGNDGTQGAQQMEWFAEDGESVSGDHRLDLVPPKR
jgi:hypothetical protein